MSLLILVLWEESRLINGLVCNCFVWWKVRSIKSCVYRSSYTVSWNTIITGCITLSSLLKLCFIKYQVIFILLQEAKAWNFFLWFFKMQAFSYMAIVFLLLRIDLTFKYWSSIYFAGHIVAVILFVVGKFILKSRRMINKHVSKTE